MKEREPTEDERRFGRVTKVREHEGGLVELELREERICFTVLCEKKKTPPDGKERVHKQLVLRGFDNIEDEAMIELRAPVNIPERTLKALVELWVQQAERQRRRELAPR